MSMARAGNEKPKGIKVKSQWEYKNQKNKKYPVLYQTDRGFLSPSFYYFISIHISVLNLMHDFIQVTALEIHV